MVRRYLPIQALSLTFVGLGFLSFASESALAQATETASKPTNTIEEVVVTAQKRAENVQNVPISVTPITGDTLERLHMNNLVDLNGSVPNFQIFENGAVALVSMITIRGIGESNNPMPYVGTEVTTVVDGAVQATDLFALADQFDLDRIEILAGPQGTLFGANTTAGVVNIITRQPTGQYGAYGEVTVGNFNTINAWGAFNFPIIDNQLSGKISVSHESSDGFFTNLYNGQSIGDQNNNTVRGYLKWTPNADLDVTLQVQAQFLRPQSTYLDTAQLTYPGEVFYRPGIPKGFVVYDDIPFPDKDNTRAVTLTANWKTPIGDLTSISNYQSYEYTENLDLSGVNCPNCFDGLPGPNGWGDQGWQASEELRDVIHPFQGVETLFGLFWQSWSDSPDSIDLLGFAAPGVISRGITSEYSTDYSGFVQSYWDITDKLQIQAGLRVSLDHKSLYRANYTYFNPAGTNVLLGQNNLVGAINLGSAPGNAPSSGSHDWTNLGGKIGANYHFTDDVMTYAYYARGFKSGGFNGAVTQSDNIGPYSPEFVDTYEAGVKSEWLDHRLQLNVSAFYNKWSDMQVEQFTFGGGMLNSVIVNAGKATTKGFEFQGQAVPIDGLQLTATVGYVSAYFNQFLSSPNPLCPPPPAVQPAGCAVSFAGRDIPYAPNWTTSLAANYTFALFGGNAETSLQYTYTSKKWGNYTEAFDERLSSIGLLNGTISWGPDDGHWTLEIWARNLANRFYVASALDVPPLFTEGVLGTPREWGATLKFNL